MPLNILLPLILRALQFFHECGYLYRNMHPQHIMQSYEDNIVIMDFKNMRKYMDLKGRLMKVTAGPSEPIN